MARYFTRIASFFSLCTSYAACVLCYFAWNCSSWSLLGSICPGLDRFQNRDGWRKIFSGISQEIPQTGLVFDFREQACIVFSVPIVIFLYSHKARKNFVFNAVYSLLLKSRKFRKIPPWLEKGVSLWARNWKKAKLEVAGDTQHFWRPFSHPFVMRLFFPVVPRQ